MNFKLEKIIKNNLSKYDYDKVKNFQNTNRLKRIDVPLCANEILVKVGNSKFPVSIKHVCNIEKVFTDYINFFDIKMDYYHSKKIMQYKAKIQKKNIFYSISNTLSLILIGNDSHPVSQKDIDYFADIVKENLRDIEKENYYIICDHTIRVYYNIDLFLDL